MLLCIQTTNEAVFAVEFNPRDSTNIITCGKSHVYFWTLSGGQLTKKQGIFGVRLTSVVFDLADISVFLNSLNVR